jgi:uncharacterized protein YmfQ (DUF2313 family)
VSDYLPLFKSHTVEEHAQSHADYMPEGKLWRGKNIVDSKLRDLLRGFGASSKRQEEALSAFWDEVFVNTTESFISDFERALGIPDDCFGIADTLAGRRRNCLLKMVSLYVVTEQDFIDLAEELGYTITITRPVDDAFPPYDVPFTPVDLKAARFTWIVNGADIVVSAPPYDVPFTPGAVLETANIMQRLFQKLKPANTSLQFLNS